MFGLRRALLLGIVLVLGLRSSRAARADDFLHGPHPFLKDNELVVEAALMNANFYGAFRAALSYGYQAYGGLWLDLRLGLQDVGSAPDALQPTFKCSSCTAALNSAVEVMAGVTYRLRMNVPVVPYVKLSTGPMYFFPTGEESTLGFGIRPAVGARYYLYDWLGFGAELGFMTGWTGLPHGNGLYRTVSVLDAGLGVAVQF